MDYSVIILISAIAFGIAWIVQMVVLCCVQLPVLRRCQAPKNKASEGEKPGVSVVIYTHNQGFELRKNIPMLMENDYPDFEVIIVDDMSVDDTEEVLTLYENKYKNLRHTSLGAKVRTMSHSKMALILGAKAAKNDIILTTQAQCMPATRNWIGCMVAYFTPNIDFVLGPVQYANSRSFTLRFFQYDLFMRMVNIFGITMWLHPYSARNTNMGFRKNKLFENNNQAFSSHLDIHPGEDDLFIAAVGKKGRVALACDPDAIISNDPHPFGESWKKARVKRAFTEKRNATDIKLLKISDALTRELFFITFIVLLMSLLATAQWLGASVVFLLMAIRVIWAEVVIHMTSEALGIKLKMIPLLIYDIFMPMADFIFWLKATFRNKGFYVGRYVV